MRIRYHTAHKSTVAKAGIAGVNKYHFRIVLTVSELTAVTQCRTLAEQIVHAKKACYHQLALSDQANDLRKRGKVIVSVHILPSSGKIHPLLL